MNVGMEDLNLWRRFFDTLRVSCRTALRDLDAGNVQHARKLIEQTEDAGRRMGLRLERAGAERPDAPPPSFESDVQLHHLNTPANRHYLMLLRETYAAALAVDRERYGADIGSDGRAQVIEDVLANVEEEVGGAVGLVRE